MKRAHWMMLCAALMANTPAQADSANSNPFLIALTEGTAVGALPQNVPFDRVAKKIKETTGSPGEITLYVARIAKFKQQPRCGRIAFAPFQESTKTLWRQFGGQINLCEDGSPPLRICKGIPDVLVMHDAVCADKSRPIDTAEVARAIEDAVAKGGLTTAEVRKRLLLLTEKKKGSTAESGQEYAK